MKTILIVVFLLISSFCFAQRDSTLYKELNQAVSTLEKQRNEITEINIKYIELSRTIFDYWTIIKRQEQIWYQEELKRK